MIRIEIVCVLGKRKILGNKDGFVRFQEQYRDLGKT